MFPARLSLSLPAATIPQDYNETHALMNLVLFDQAMHHVARISRILQVRCACAPTRAWCPLAAYVDALCPFSTFCITSPRSTSDRLNETVTTEKCHAARTILETISQYLSCDVEATPRSSSFARLAGYIVRARCVRGFCSV